MDKRQLEALVRRNLKKAGSPQRPARNFGKKYSGNLADEPVDEATLKERAASERFFKEMRKREF